MICHSSTFSPSGIYCCPSNSPCLETKNQPPTCESSASACGEHLGGGCCPHGTQCAADGCLKVYRAAPGFEASSVLSGTQSPPSPVATRTTTTTTTTKSGQGPTASPTDGVTVTTPKIGETALSAAPEGPRPKFGFSSCASLEVCALSCAAVFAYFMVWRGV